MIWASARRLSVFKSVADAGGFNSAAIRLGITQPSVGAHIKALELQLGQPLFHRRPGSRPVLTEAGETLYVYATEVLQRAETADHVLRDLRARYDAEVSLAIHRDVAPRMLSAHLAEFSERVPTARMTTRTGTIEDVLALTREGVVHLGFVLASGPIIGLESHALFSVPLCLIVSPDHPLAIRQHLVADEVTRYPFFTGLRASHYMTMVDQALHDIGISTYEVAMQLQDAVSVKEMVRRGKGIAVLPACTVEQEIETGALRSLHLARQPAHLEIRCLYRAPITRPAQTILSFLHSRN